MDSIDQATEVRNGESLDLNSIEPFLRDSLPGLEGELRLSQFPLQTIRFAPTHVPGALTRQEIVAHYARLAGKSIDKIDFYLVFGVFRLAVIAQQIYYRNYHGQTRDQRFKAFVSAVNILDRTAKRFMDRSDC